MRDCPFGFQNLSLKLAQLFVIETLYILDYLGRALVKLSEIHTETSQKVGPLIKKLILKDAEAGEIDIKLDLHLFQSN